MFKQDRRKLKIVNWKGGNVKPSQGCYTLYWWRKGNPIDQYYFKADLYGLDGDIFQVGIIDETYDALITQVEEIIGVK